MLRHKIFTTACLIRDCYRPALLKDQACRVHMSADELLIACKRARALIQGLGLKTKQARETVEMLTEAIEQAESRL
jgi:hypothetical protein